jgi:hypothetical protein
MRDEESIEVNIGHRIVDKNCPHARRLKDDMWEVE